MNLKALDLTVDKCDGTRLEKDILKRKLRKLAKHGDLARMTPLFLYRYCCARFALGDYSDYTGWEWRSDNGWAAAMHGPQPLPRWKGEYVERLWVIGEQGIGDEIFFASLLPECLARVKEVVYECDKRIHGIIERSFPRTVCVERPDGDDWKSRSGVFIPAGDLLRFFRRDIKHFPARAYLKADPERIESYRDYAGRIGMATQGRQGSMDPSRLGIDGAVSVQYGDPSSPVDARSDIEGLFALVSVLGRIVTVPQTAHHIAGSIGTPVDIIIPETEGEVRNQVPWDYPVGKLPWYPNAFVYPSIEEWKRACNATASNGLNTIPIVTKSLSIPAA